MFDGDSDETPQFPKLLQTGVALFEELKLNVLLHSVNAADLFIRFIQEKDEWRRFLTIWLELCYSMTNSCDSHLQSVW